MWLKLASSLGHTINLIFNNNLIMESSSYRMTAPHMKVICKLDLEKQGGSLPPFSNWKDHGIVTFTRHYEGEYYLMPCAIGMDNKICKKSC